LSDGNWKVLEAWVAEFRRSWKEDLLPRRVAQLPPAGSSLRLPALTELVKMDMALQWRAGRQVAVTHYLRAYAELSIPERVLSDLVQLECDLRQQYGSGALVPAEPTVSPATEHTPTGRADERTVRPSATVPPRTPASFPAFPSMMPERFDRYQVIRRLGKGAMGSIYLAQDTQLDRLVALKVPDFRSEENTEQLQRFYREAQAAAKLEHPNLCPVYDVGQHNGIHFLAIAYVEGTPLHEYAKKTPPLDASQIANLIARVALAMNYAHQRGVVHRDLKPANIMITRRQEPMVVDFGLALHQQGGDQRLTVRGVPLGTPAYMAPEQVKGDVEAMGPACDIFGLGVILYELLAGRLPFEGSSLMIMTKVLTEDAPPPSVHGRPVPAPLEAICKKAMARQIADRYPSMADFATDLLAFQDMEHQRTVVEPEAPHRPAPSWLDTQPPATPARPKKGWGRIPGAVAVGLVLLTGGTFATKWVLAQRAARHEAQESCADGQRFLQKGDFDAAIRAFERATVLNPHSAEAFRGLGDAHAKRNDPREAVENYDRALAFEPNHAETYCKRGEAYLALRKFDEALEDFNKARRLDLQSARAPFLLGEAYLARAEAARTGAAAKEDLGKAFVHYNQAVTAAPANAEYLLGRARAYEKSGRKDLADVDRKKAEELRKAATRS
jgi:tetratricopeptide (TPR) repeat protein/tRNA A-37 threonylcarbamoyl transferase component Bud32